MRAELGKLQWWHWVMVWWLFGGPPVWAVWGITEPGSTVHTVLAWYCMVVYYPGFFVWVGLVIAIYGGRHFLLHRRIAAGLVNGPCPWCRESELHHTLSDAEKRKRGQLREKLREQEFR